ncbi:MAG TPA: hypothetical protein DIU39_04915, partial [Flavobacteriales bacterium]|nr:hypothetical protein [Flavobacteriales bacterium]
GSGTQTNGVTTASPNNIYYRRQVAHFVYTKAEINAAGKNIGDTIKAIGFYVASKSLYDIPGYTIQMKHTTRSNVSNSLGTTGWTTVKNPFTFAQTTGEWNMIVLDQPFVWDGTNNLAIQICWSQVQPNWDPSGQVYVFSSNRGYRYRRDDNSGSICGQNPGTRINIKPQIRIKFKDYTTWRGTVSTDWFDPANWDAGVPTKDFDAFISASAPNMPVISGSGAVCQNLSVRSGASLTISGTDSLTIYGNYNNQGAFTANNSTLVFRGNTTSTFDVAGTHTLYNMSVLKAKGVIVQSGTVNIQNNLTIRAAVLNTGNAITLLSNAGGDARIPRIGNSCKYVLTMNDSWGDGWNGGFLTLFVDGAEEGRYMAKTYQTIDTLYIPDGSTFYLTYTSGSYENENSYTLKDPSGTTVYSDGPNPTTGTVYSATSACSFINPISGTITVQRYIDAGATNWRFLTTPVQGTVLEDWDDDFVTSGFPGTDFPNWPSVTNPWASMYFYDETVPGPQNNGFTAPSSTSAPVSPGTGVWVWCGDTITGTQPFTIDVTGAPNVGPINLPVSYTNTGDPDDGWSMVGNPYPCEIDWDSPNWTKTNINSAIYIWNPDLQQFSSYVAGIGTNGGSRFIASSQAFWVQTNGASPQLTANEFVKTTTPANFIRQNTANIAQIVISGGNGSDETAIRIDNDNATLNFDANLDAQKMYSTSNVPSIATEMSNIDYSVNSIPFNQSLTIPVKVLTQSSGIYTLTFNNMDAFENASCITLVDNFTGQTKNLKSVNTYTFYLSDTTTSARFTLQIGAPVLANINQPTCQNTFDGSVNINIGYQGASTYELFDDENNLLTSTNDSTGNITFNNLSEGTYIVNISVSGCGAYTDTLVVLGSNSVYAKFDIPTDTIHANKNVTIINQTQNATSYLWNFGDGNQSTDATPVHSYTNTGNYTITLTAENQNCTDNVSQTITVIDDATTSVSENNLNKDVETYFNDNDLIIKNNKATYTAVIILDVNGKEVYRSNIQNKLAVNTAKWSSGTYLVKFTDKANNRSFTKKIIKP